MGSRKRTNTENNSRSSLPFSLEFRFLSVLLFLALIVEFSLIFLHDLDSGAAIVTSVNNRFAAVKSPRQLFRGPIEKDVDGATAINDRVVVPDMDAEKPGVDDTENKLIPGAKDKLIPAKSDKGPPHLDPRPPYLPPFATIPNADALAADVLSGKPTITGIIAMLTKFLEELHDYNRDIKNKRPQVTRDEVYETYHSLALKHLLPFDEVYRGKPIFDIRNDDSMFMSLAAYREHLLAPTLREAFSHAANPDKLFIGAVVQNCFGLEYTCRTGVQVVGKDDQGRPKVKVSDAPPDINGIDEFCNDPDYAKYCESGQIRALYVNETESVGPASARYLASKLWGGETYFVQSDSHLHFAQNWDALYIKELRLANGHPKAILSAYPPGFEAKFGDKSVGTKLCTCEFSQSDVEFHILRIGNGMNYDRGNIPPNPRQIPFMAAGFFFVRSEWLVDVPFDPLLPWCFMGEEIALSMRSWTSGWKMYAPRYNLIAHQYRPGRMGLPKFWETVGRTYGRPGPGFNTNLQSKVIKRIKNLVGYPAASEENIKAEGDGIVLDDLHHYGLGNEETYEAFLEFAGIDVINQRCNRIKWCNQGLLE